MFFFSFLQNISYGTIPYLGTFLTDLTMIDTAIPDTIAEGLINFDKRRKEFEVLARIRLLQGAANAYNFSTDPRFDRWFHSIVVLDDREAYKLSCQIEQPPPGNTLNNRAGKNKKQVNIHFFFSVDAIWLNLCFLSHFFKIENVKNVLLYSIDNVMITLIFFVGIRIEKWK